MSLLRDRTARSVGVLASAVAAALGVGLTAPAQAAEATASAGQGEGRVSLVVLSAPGSRPESVASDLGRSDLVRRGLRVGTATPTRSTFTVEVPASRQQAMIADIAGRPGVVAVAPLTTFRLADVPNDRYFSYQSHYLKALHLPKAWSLTHGSSDVRIAVIDSGADVAHPDLTSKIVGTYNAADGTSDVTDEDPEFHGTRVASMAAAATGNGSGIAGAGWASSLLVVKVEDEFGAITSDKVAAGVRWAVDHHADVINMSLGAEESDAVTRAAVDYAIDHDVVVVAAAGNGGVTRKVYPAALPGVLSVGATGPGGVTRAWFSQHGGWVDVGAPGMSIWGADAETNGYVTGDGTSFASPLVAGIAGLVRAFRPELSQSQVQKAIVATSGRSTLGFGHGLVNAAAALAYRPAFAGPPSVSVVGGSPVTGKATVAVGGVSDPLVTRVMARLLAGGPTVSGPVTAGSATVTLPTYGTSGQETLRVVTCRKSVCSTTGTDIRITVDNPVPELTEPNTGTEVTGDFTVAAKVVSADAPVPAVRFLADGAVVLGTDVTGTSGTGDRIDFSVPVSIHALGAGTHTITAVACDATGTTCATDAASTGRTVIVNRLTPLIESVAPSPFSPNGDRHKDHATVTYTLDVAAEVTITVQRSDGSTFLTRHLGEQPAGRHTWDWNGKGTGSGTGVSGTYAVVVDTAATVDGKDLVGEAGSPVVIDLAKPGMNHRAASRGTVYPVRDGYGDSVRLSVQVTEPTSALTLTVTDTRHRTVWRATRKGAGAGTNTFTFRGRRTSGSMLVTGTYHYWFTATDRAGNVRSSTHGSLRISHRHLSGVRTAHKTVTPYSTFDYFVVGNEADGSQVWRTNWGPGSLLWEPAGGSVMSFHRTKLPKAAVYGTLRIDAYGRGSSGATAYLYDIATSGKLVRSSYGWRTGTHSGRTVSGASMLKGQKVRWAIQVFGADMYEIKTFTITWTYRVLV